MDNLHNKKNVFVRVLVVFFCLILVSMIVFSYFIVEPKGQINSGVVILLLLLLILVLSESFDNFSIGKLISITREAQKKEKELQKLEKENKKLISQLITISCNQNQHQHQTQHHTNVYGDYHEGKNLSVERASEQEIQAKVSNERSRASEAPAEQKYRIDYRNLESIAMQKYVLQKGVYAENIISEAKLVTKFYGIDPISDFQPIFDGYYKDDDKEIFIDFKIINRGFLFSSREKLYMMLSKLNHYKIAKGANVHLDLVLFNIEEDKSNNRNSIILKNFGPAVSSGLLKINKITISKEEFDSCKKYFE